MSSISALKDQAEQEAYTYFDQNIRAFPRDVNGNMIIDSSTAHNNDVDAFRHAYVSGVLTMERGSFVAEILGTGHEFLNPNPPSETNMDLWNNADGRFVGELATSRADLAQRVHVRLTGGDLITSVSDTRDFTGYEAFTPSQNYTEEFEQTLGSFANWAKNDSSVSSVYDEMGEALHSFVFGSANAAEVESESVGNISINISSDDKSISTFVNKNGQTNSTIVSSTNLNDTQKAAVLANVAEQHKQGGGSIANDSTSQATFVDAANDTSTTLNVCYNDLNDTFYNNMGATSVSGVTVGNSGDTSVSLFEDTATTIINNISYGVGEVLGSVEAAAEATAFFVTQQATFATQWFGSSNGAQLSFATWLAANMGDLIDGNLACQRTY